MSLTLSLISETSTTITLGWTPVPGCVGYRFTAETQAKPSHTWDPTKSTVKFSKGSSWYKVEALGVQEFDTWPDAAPPPTGIKLRDKPPGYPDYPGFLRVTNDGRGYYSWSDTQDVLFTLGDHTYEEGIALVGGRKVVIIGGHITATGSARGYGVGLAVQPRVDDSHYYLEGIRIKPDKINGQWQRHLHDGIALRGNRGKLTMQNMLVGPCGIIEGFTDTSHADVFQIQADPGTCEIRVDYFTGYTAYSAVMESEFIVKKQDWSHVNMVATGYSDTDLDPLTLGSQYRGHTVFGMYGAAPAANMPNLTFNEFYWAKDPQQSFQGYTPIELVTQKGGKYGKPKDASGKEYDFVTEAALPLNYVSPGYV